MNIYMHLLIFLLVSNSFVIRDVRSRKYIRVTDSRSYGTSSIRLATKFTKKQSKGDQAAYNILKAGTREALDYLGAGNVLILYGWHDGTNQRFKFKLDRLNRLQIFNPPEKYLFYDAVRNEFLGDPMNKNSTGFEILNNDGFTEYKSKMIPKKPKIFKQKNYLLNAPFISPLKNLIGQNMKNKYMSLYPPSNFLLRPGLKGYSTALSLQEPLNPLERYKLSRNLGYAKENPIVGERAFLKSFNKKLQKAGYNETDLRDAIATVVNDYKLSRCKSEIKTALHRLFNIITRNEEF